MTTEISTSLLNLKKDIESIKRNGDFLLSVNKLSHYWIYIDKLWEAHPRYYDLIESCLEIIFQNLLAEYDSFTPFSPGPNTGSTEDLPMHIFADNAREYLQNPSIRRVVRIGVDSTERQEPSNYVGIFAFSLHIDLIKRLVANIRRSRGCEVLAIIALIEREKVSRPMLDELGVKLIPLILADEDGNIRTILETFESPYSDMHKYFQYPVKDSLNNL